MSPPRFRAVYCDLDGTLLDPQRRISPRTLAVFATLQQRGVRIGIASGRTFRSARPYLKESGSDAPAILFQGARLLALDGAVHAETPLPAQAGRPLVELARREGIFVNCYHGDAVRIEERGPVAEASAAKDGVEQELVDDLAALITATPPTKLMMIAAAERLDAFEALVRAEIKARQLPARVVRSEPEYLEALAPGVSKGSALPAAAKLLGIELSEVIAFGDQLNDLEMIAAAGMGIAMGNAHPEVQRVAARVCGSNADEGVAAELERLFQV